MKERSYATFRNYFYLMKRVGKLCFAWGSCSQWHVGPYLCSGLIWEKEKMTRMSQTKKGVSVAESAFIPHIKNHKLIAYTCKHFFIFSSSHGRKCPLKAILKRFCYRKNSRVWIKIRSCCLWGLGISLGSSMRDSLGAKVTKNNLPLEFYDF